MTLDEMLDGAAAGAAEIAEGWGQGRAVFGGLVGGLLVARAEAVTADPARHLRSASISFAGPVTPGAAAVEAEVLRAGSSATHVATRVVQDGEVRAALLAEFALGRGEPIALDADARSPRPAMPAPETLQRIPIVNGFTPDFFRHVELVPATGGLPFTGAPEPDFTGWMRLAAPPRAFGVRELVTLVDAWPPAVAPVYDGPVPMSTATWTYQPVAPPAEPDAPDAWWGYAVRTLVSDPGHAHTTARVWDAAGRLRGLSHQTISVFG